VFVAIVALNEAVFFYHFATFYVLPLVTFLGNSGLRTKRIIRVFYFWKDTYVR